MIRRLSAVLIGAVLAVATADAAAASESSKALQIYFVDVEGGQATLFVSPSGESLLIDTGWPGQRDADRIAAAAKLARVQKLDYVLITHYHRDHVGGVPSLVQKIPAGTFIDHGALREPGPPMDEDYAAYQKVLGNGKYKHITVAPGDSLPIEGLQAVVVSSDGQLLAHALRGAGEPNSYCKTTEARPADQTENARSIGVLLTFGKLRILDLGDLTWDKEMGLMCPANLLGSVDIYVVSHHGFEQSGSPALVDGIHPRVAIMDNGAKKGGSPSAWQIVYAAPGLQDLWQLHYSIEGGKDHNVADQFIANVGDKDEGNYLKLTAHPDGTFSVFNSRTNFEKSY
jgi:beta-lactamase superfamily II metal-dependent hydrolase